MHCTVHWKSLLTPTLLYIIPIALYLAPYCKFLKKAIYAALMLYLWAGRHPTIYEISFLDLSNKRQKLEDLFWKINYSTTCDQNLDLLDNCWLDRSVREFCPIVGWHVHYSRHKCTSVGTINDSFSSDSAYWKEVTYALMTCLVPKLCSEFGYQ